MYLLTSFCNKNDMHSIKVFVMTSYIMVSQENVCLPIAWHQKNILRKTKLENVETMWQRMG